jgi:GNAT superfamily N-acetyltransferase
MREIGLKRSELLDLSAEVLQREGTLKLRVRGSSMFPFIRSGDVVAIEPIHAAQLQPGGVVLYRSGRNRLAIHRVMRLYRDGSREMFSIRGDAYAGPCEEVQSAQILGRVVRVERQDKAERTYRLAVSQGAVWWRLWHPTGPLLLATVRTGRQLVVWSHGRFTACRQYRRLARKIAATHVRCRLASESDIPALCRLYGSIIPRAVVERGVDHRYTLVATLHGMLAGATDLHPGSASNAPQAELWLSSLQVRARFRGLGVGEQLTRVAMQRASQADAKQLSLYVFSHNRAAIALYRKLGFCEASATAQEPGATLAGHHQVPERVLMRWSVSEVREG